MQKRPKCGIDPKTLQLIKHFQQEGRDLTQCGEEHVLIPLIKSIQMAVQIQILSKI